MTFKVETEKVALVTPAGTVTLAGTFAAVVILLKSVTEAPPAGAAAVRVTVPVDVWPAITGFGASASDFSVGVGLAAPSLKRKAS